MLFCKRFKKSFLFVVSLAVLFCAADVHAGKKKSGGLSYAQKQYKKGVSELEKKIYSSAHLCFSNAARKGHAEAQYELGLIYLGLTPNKIL